MPQSKKPTSPSSPSERTKDGSTWGLLPWIGVTVLVLLGLLATCAVTRAQTHPGDQGTAETDFIDRGLMDLIYMRKDGLLDPDISPFGDPNAPGATRGWRIFYSKTNYADASYDGSDFSMNLVGGVGVPAYGFSVAGTQFFGGNLVNDPTTAVGELTAIMGARDGDNRVMADAYIADNTGLGAGAEKVVTFSLPGSLSTGPVNIVTGVQAIRWKFHPQEANHTFGSTAHYFYWTGVYSQTAKFGHNMHVRNDPNTVYTDWDHWVGLNRVTGTKEHIAEFNETWIIKQTDATRDIISFYNGITSEWTLDKSGNWVDNTSANLVDGVDVSTLPTADTNANTICSGTTTYLDGEGNCDTIVSGMSSWVVGDGSSTGTVNDTEQVDLVAGTDITTTYASVLPDDHQVTIAFDGDLSAGTTLNGATISTGAHTADTNANTICSGTDVYLDGEGNCDTITTGGGGADVKSGTVSITEGTPQTITFNTAFSGTPYCTCTLEPGAVDETCWISTAASTTAVSFDWDNSAGGPAASTNVNWICTDAGDP